MSKTLFFVTPAYRRYEVSEVCFAHRAWAIEELRQAGINAECVVVTDDENADIARSYGFHVRERENDYLGARWNDGYEYAAQNGAGYIVPIGSDSWIHPCFFNQLPRTREILTSRYYAIVDETGSRLARLEIDVAGGVGPNVIPVVQMKRRNYRPIPDKIPKGCDTALMRTVTGARTLFLWADVHPLQYFAFRIEGEQINPYDKIVKRHRPRVSLDPWGMLARLHPQEFVDQAQRVYAGVLA